MILALYDHPEGIETNGGNIAVYDVDHDKAYFGAASVAGRALVWRLEEQGGVGEKLAAPVALDPNTEWLLRCDRVDFRPEGSRTGTRIPAPDPVPAARVDPHRERWPDPWYEALEPWFEAGPEPVLAVASAAEETAFVRAMLVPLEWAGRRTISYVDPADEEKPKLQRATVFFD